MLCCAGDVRHSALLFACSEYLCDAYDVLSIVGGQIKINAYNVIILVKSLNHRLTTLGFVALLANVGEWLRNK